MVTRTKTAETFDAAVTLALHLSGERGGCPILYRDFAVLATPGSHAIYFRVTAAGERKITRETWNRLIAQDHIYLYSSGDRWAVKPNGSSHAE